MRLGASGLPDATHPRSPLGGRGGKRGYAVTAFDRAAKLLRSFCSLGGITAMQ